MREAGWFRPLTWRPTSRNSCMHWNARKREGKMANLSVRNLSDKTHLALKLRANANGRSMNAEVRRILLDALYDSGHVKLGTYLAERSREFGGVDLNIERDRSPIEPATFD